MLSTGLVAIDSAVLPTAVPSIVGELSGFHQFTWLFSAYLLGQSMTTPIYAKLSDVFGRKPILLWGIGAVDSVSTENGHTVAQVVCEVGSGWTPG